MSLGRFGRLAGISQRNGGVLYSIPVRGMATEKQLRDRIKSVVSIEKITTAMQMVAAVKMRQSEKRLLVTREFAKNILELGKVDEDEDTPVDLMVGLSADRGLCGGINSSMVRGIRDQLKEHDKEGLRKLMLVGEKAKPGLERLFSKQLAVTLSATGNGKPVSFRNSAVMADFWLEQEFTKTQLCYQYFKNKISYITQYEPYLSLEGQNEDDLLDYEMEGDSDVLQNLFEFRLAVGMCRALAEQETSTEASRMTAMDNSSENAKEMIEELTLKANRMRQAKITTELIEIISGAAAVDDASKK